MSSNKGKRSILIAKKIENNAYPRQLTTVNTANMNNNQGIQITKIKSFNKILNIKTMKRCSSYGIIGSVSSGSTSIETVQNCLTRKGINDNLLSISSGKSRNYFPELNFQRGLNTSNALSPLSPSIDRNKYKRSFSLLFNFNTINSNITINNNNIVYSTNGNNYNQLYSPTKPNLILQKTLLKNRSNSVAKDCLFKINEMKTNAFQDRSPKNDERKQERAPALNHYLINCLTKKVTQIMNKKRINGYTNDLRKEIDQMRIIKAMKKPTITYKFKVNNSLEVNSKISLNLLRKELCNEIKQEWAESIHYFLDEFDTIIYQAQPMPFISINQINAFRYYLFTVYLCPYKALLNQMKEEVPIRAKIKTQLLDRYSSNEIINRKRTPIVNNKTLFLRIMSKTKNLSLFNLMSANNLAIRHINNIISHFNTLKDKNMYKKNKLKSKFECKNLTLKTRKSNSNWNKVLRQKSFFDLTGHNCKFGLIRRHSVLYSSNLLSPHQMKEKDKLNSIIFFKTNSLNENDRSLKQPLIEKEVFNKLVQYIREQNEEMFKYTFENKTMRYDINTKYDKNNTLLNISVQQNQSNIALYLLNKGADPNVANVYLNIPLHYAISNKNFSLASSLIDFKADENYKNIDGVIPWQCVNSACKN